MATDLPSLLGLSDNAPGVREGAGFWLRTLARVIDTLVHYAVTIAAMVALGVVLGIACAIQGVPLDPLVTRLTRTGWLTYVALISGSVAMHTLAEGLHGSTLGKRLCGLTVVSEDGSPATPLAAFKRSLAFFLDSLFFGALGAMKMAESARRQRIGDLWAGTQVVHLSSLEPDRQRSWVRFAAAAVLGIFINGIIQLTELVSRLL